MAAFSSYVSDIVSIAIMSTPFCTPIFIVFLKIFMASSKSKSPIGFNSLPSGPISRATNLSSLFVDFSLAIFAFSTPFATTCSIV